MKMKLDVLNCGRVGPVSSQLHLNDELISATCADDSGLRRAVVGTLQNLLELISTMLCTPETIMLILDSQGRIVCLNEICEEVLGCSHEEAYGTHLVDLFHNPEERARAQKAIAKIILTRSRHTYESELAPEEGSFNKKRIRWSMAATSDGNGQIRYIVVNGIDVTEYRWAEKEREANIDLLQLINSIHNTQELINTLVHFFRKWSGCECVGIRLCDGYDFPYYNAIGFSREFVLAENRLRALDDKGDSLSDSNRHRLRECLCGNIIDGRFDTSLLQYTDKGSFWTNSMTEMAAQAEETSRPPVRTSMMCRSEGYESMALIPLGSDKGIFGLLQLCDRRCGKFSKNLVFLLERLADSVGIALAKRQTEENHLRLVAAVEQAAECFILLDKAQTVKYVNSAFERLTGYSRDEAMNREPDFLNGGPNPQTIYQHIWETVAGGRIWTGRITNKRKDGTPYEAELTISPLQDHAGIVLNYVIILRDVSHESRLERQLRQAQKMEAMGTLAGGIAHDFNNILAPIIGYAELAMSKIVDDDPLKNNFEQIFKAAKRAAELVRQILTFSRQTEQERRPVHIGPLVNEALKLLRASLPSTIEIHHNIMTGGESDRILADPTQVHQILMNLCANAGYAMRERGGVLEVNLVNTHVDSDSAFHYSHLEPGSYLHLSVSDTGIGMDDMVRQRIFEPYFTTKPQGEGTGMGLAVVYGIVKNHQGAITVYSEPGKGTIFHVLFPRIDVQNTSTSGIEPGLPIPTGHERILFVDDEPTMVRMGQQMIKQLGYEVAVRATSIDALEAFRANPNYFDLIITDQTMPNMTGTELAQEILNIRPDIPIIVCTGFSEFIDESNAGDMGFSGFLMKPVLMADMARVIREALAKKTREKAVH